MTAPVSRRPSLPTVASAPTGAMQPASRTVRKHAPPLPLPRFQVVKLTEKRCKAFRSRPGTRGKCALGRGGQHPVGGESFGHRCRATEPDEPGGGQHHRVQVTGNDPAQPSVDIAADGTHFQVAAQGEQLCATSRRTGADGGAHRQLRQAHPVPGAQHVCRVLPVGTAASSTPGAGAVGKSL